MQKVSNIFSNLFSRSRSRLETDAVPVPDNNSNQSIRSPETSMSSGIFDMPETLQSQDNQLVATNSSLVPSNSSLLPIDPADATNTTNNILALNRTQGYNVYQFTHVKGLHIGSVYNINNEKETNPDGKQQKRPRTHTIKEMMECGERLPLNILNVIATHLGEGWQDVFRKLSYSEGQLHQAIVDYKIDGGMKEVIYQLLLDWTQNDDNPSLGRITELLWNSGHTETVYFMKKVWKSEKSTVKS